MRKGPREIPPEDWSVVEQQSNMNRNTLLLQLGLTDMPWLGDGQWHKSMSAGTDGERAL